MITSDEASSEPYDVSVVSYLWHTSSITHYEPKPADQVVGLVVIDEPRPTGRTPEKESSGSSSSERAAQQRDEFFNPQLIGKLFCSRDCHTYR